MALPASRYDEWYSDSGQSEGELSQVFSAGLDALLLDSLPPKPSEVSNVMVNFLLEGIAGAGQGTASFHVSVESFDTVEGTEFLACVPESRALCGYGRNQETAIGDLLDGLIHDLTELGATGVRDLTRDAQDHLEFIRSLLHIR